MYQCSTRLYSSHMPEEILKVNASIVPKRIIVIGGGFAGLNLIKSMAGNNQYIITLVDKNNFNQFTPLVYQVATGFLEPSNITYPFHKFV